MYVKGRGAGLGRWLVRMRCDWQCCCGSIELRFVFLADLADARERVILWIVPVFLECQRCTACCRWPGQVRLTTAEITRLAAFKGLSEYDFIQQFTRLTSDRRGLALLDQPDGACVFLEQGECTVQPVKPQQCRDFPNLWNFPGAAGVCRALPQQVDEAEQIRRVAAATGRSLAEVASSLRR